MRQLFLLSILLFLTVKASQIQKILVENKAEIAVNENTILKFEYKGPYILANDDIQILEANQSNILFKMLKSEIVTIEGNGFVTIYPQQQTRLEFPIRGPRDKRCQEGFIGKQCQIKYKKVNSQKQLILEHQNIEILKIDKVVQFQKWGKCIFVQNCKDQELESCQKLSQRNLRSFKTYNYLKVTNICFYQKVDNKEWISLNWSQLQAPSLRQGPKFIILTSQQPTLINLTIFVVLTTISIVSYRYKKKQSIKRVINQGIQNKQ